MRVFVTGGTGHTGSYIIPELIAAGHEVTGLARSDTATAAMSALGAKVRRGDLARADAHMVADPDRHWSASALWSTSTSADVFCAPMTAQAITVLPEAGGRNQHGQ
jgi:nucleoside-diphosphate-sugar epimerase